MNEIFINLTNHPSATWDADQKMAAQKYGRIVDLEFPQVPAAADEGYVNKLVRKYYRIIRDTAERQGGGDWKKGTTVLLQGEFTFTCQLAGLLRAEGIPVLSACSERAAEEQTGPDGVSVKRSWFRFVRFRAYA